jgi:hypothetical protein
LLEREGEDEGRVLCVARVCCPKMRGERCIYSGQHLTLNNIVVDDIINQEGAQIRLDIIINTTAQARNVYTPRK